MRGKDELIACCFAAGALLLLMRAGAQAQTIAPDEVQRQAPAIAKLLRSDDPVARQKTLDLLREIASSSPRPFADNLPQWLDPLLATGQYDDIEKFCLLAIEQKANDVATVIKAQEARTKALLARGDYKRAVVEAKSYYNVASLGGTESAIALMAEALEKSGSAPVAARFKFEQSAGAQPPTTAPVVKSEPDVDGEVLLAAANVLKGITVASAPYAANIQALQARTGGGASYGNLVARGNLMLLSDRADEAMKCYVAACCNGDNKGGKQMREAVEGIARAIRARDGVVGSADAIVLALRVHPGEAIPALAPVDQEKLRTAAQQTVLANLQSGSAPPLEQRRARAESGSENASTDIKFGFDFECASPMEVRRISPTHFALTAHSVQWFMFRIDGAAGKTIRIDVTNPNATVDKWQSLNPVYSSIPSLDSLDGFTAAAPTQGAVPIAAWNGALLPVTSGQKWHYIADAWKVDGKTLGFVHRFESDREFVAMRVPYTPGYNTEYLKRVSNNPLGKVIEIGRSVKGRPLSVVVIGKTNSPSDRQKPCVLVYAREHPDEPDASWAAQGLIDFLLSNDVAAQELRSRTIFMIIPVFDPDGAASSVHEGMIKTFAPGEATPESNAYANWMKSLIDADNRLDIVFALHNVQSRECTHVACALMEGTGARGEISSALQSVIVAEMLRAGFTVAPGRWSTSTGAWFNRLTDWASRCYGAISFIYELNSQEPGQHLTIAQTKDIGRAFGMAVDRYLRSADAMLLLDEVDARRAARLKQVKDRGEALVPVSAIEFEPRRF